MLVLSRKSQQKIQIGDQITISVLAVKGNVVRIGIDAPTNIHIVRGELPPLDKNAKAVVRSAAKVEESVCKAAPTPTPQVMPSAATDTRTFVQSHRVSMHRYPALQSRLNRRLDVLKSEECATK